jgi:hypothetical protein
VWVRGEELHLEVRSAAHLLLAKPKYLRADEGIMITCSVLALKSTWHDQKPVSPVCSQNLGPAGVRAPCFSQQAQCHAPGPGS